MTILRPLCILAGETLPLCVGFLRTFASPVKRCRPKANKAHETAKETSLPPQKNMGGWLQWGHTEGLTTPLMKDSLDRERPQQRQFRWVGCRGWPLVGDLYFDGNCLINHLPRCPEVKGGRAKGRPQWQAMAASGTPCPSAAPFGRPQGRGNNVRHSRSLLLTAPAAGPVADERAGGEQLWAWGQANRGRWYPRGT